MEKGTYIMEKGFITGNILNKRYILKDLWNVFLVGFFDGASSSWRWKMQQWDANYDEMQQLWWVLGSYTSSELFLALITGAYILALWGIHLAYIFVPNS